MMRSIIIMASEGSTPWEAISLAFHLLALLWFSRLSVCHCNCRFPNLRETFAIRILEGSSVCNWLHFTCDIKFCDNSMELITFNSRFFWLAGASPLNSGGCLHFFQHHAVTIPANHHWQQLNCCILGSLISLPKWICNSYYLGKSVLLEWHKCSDPIHLTNSKDDSDFGHLNRYWWCSPKTR